MYATAKLYQPLFISVMPLNHHCMKRNKKQINHYSLNIQVHSHIPYIPTPLPGCCAESSHWDDGAL